MKVVFVGVDNPHGAGWRELLLNLDRDELSIAAIVPGYGGTIYSLEERYAEVPRFASVEEALERVEFDGAIVCLPNDEGPQVATTLAKKGKHILLEKPIAGCAEDMDPIVKAVKKQSVSFQCGYMWRYDEAANRLRGMLEEGRFGDLISVEMQFITSDVNRRGPEHYLFDREICKGGFFNWLGCHYLDLLLYVTQQKVVAVQAMVGAISRRDCDVEDGGVVTLQLESGGLVTFTGGYWIPRWAGEAGWTVRGTQRWVHWYPNRAGGELEIHGPQPQWHAMEETFSVAPDDTIGYGGANGLALVREWLYNAKKGGACRNTAHSARETLRLVDAIYESSRTGKRIACQIG